MKIAILGGGGCFALNFARLCNERGIDHFGIGRSHKPPSFWQIDHHYRYWKLHLVNELPAVMAVLDTERPDVIVNFAAQGEGAASFEDNAPAFFKTNAVGLCALVVELRKRDYLRRFVNIGTSELYGPTEHPAKETDPLWPSSPYAISKAAFDLYLVSMHRNFGFPMNIIRPSNCYTPGQQLHRVIPKAIVCALSGTKLPLQGGGKAEKSYLHATDLSSAVLSVIDKAPIGKIYNVSPYAPISILALVGLIAETCGLTLDQIAEVAPDRVGQDAKYWLDASSIAKDTGWTYGIGMRKGLGEMVEWVRKYPELLTMDSAFVMRD